MGKMARQEQIYLIVCFLVLWIAEHALALNPRGRNVCSTTQQYVAYEARRHTQTITESYRTCCRRKWGVCYSRCTRYRTRNHVYYSTVSHIRSRPIYFCCDGWRQAGSECTIPVCLTPCKHGDCVWPNTCRCHSGFEGPYCRNDINECKRMGLPDGFVPTPSQTTTTVMSTTSQSSVPSSSTRSPFTSTSSTNVAVSSFRTAKGGETSSVTHSSPSVSPLQPSPSANKSFSSSTQMISASLATKAAPSTPHASPSSNTNDLTSVPEPSLSSTIGITSLMSSHIGTKESSSVNKTTSLLGQSSLSTLAASKSTLSLSQVSSSLFPSRVAGSTVSLVSVSTSQYLTANASQALSSVTALRSFIYSSDFPTSSASLGISTSEPTIPKVSSIAPSSSLVVISSSIGSSSGSGFGSGEESGSGWIEPDDVIGEDYLPRPYRRQRRDSDNKEVVPKVSKDNLPAQDPSPISYPYRCTHTCSNTYGSFKCGCYTGYYLHSDKKTCYDINECAKGNGGCSHRCVNTVGSYRCECPHPSLYLWKDKHTCKAHGMSIICTKDYMQVNFEKQLLRGLDVEHLRLTDSSCKGWDNRTHLILRTELDKCGTVYEEKGDIEIYKNAVVNRDITIGNIITRIRGIRVPFQCSYRRVAHVSGVGIRPDSHRLTFTEDGFGQFTFTLSMFHGPRYRTAYSHHQFPIQVKLRDRLYFEVKVISEDANLIVFAEKCVATPYIQRGKGPEYVFLENGCAKDSTLSYSVYSPYSYQRFSLEAFRFLDDVPDVYFHCDVIACHKSNRNSRCFQGCQARGKRQTRDVNGKKETGTYSIAEGPLSLRSIRSLDEESKKSASTLYGLPQYSLFIAGIACTALLVGSLKVVKQYQSRKGTGYQKLATHECQD